MKTLKQYKDKQMADVSFAVEYEAMQPEMDVVRAIVEARTWVTASMSLPFWIMDEFDTRDCH